MFGHENIFLFCSVPMKNLEIHFHMLSPQSKRVLSIKVFDCDRKVILKLVALSDHCYCMPEPARCCCMLEPAALGTRDWWEVQGFACCRMLQEGHISSGKLTLGSLVKKCLRYATATFLQGNTTFRWRPNLVYTDSLLICCFNNTRLLFFSAELKLQQKNCSE